MKYRLHVIAPPHTGTTRQFYSCAYTEKARKFCNEMTRRGHTVYLYGGYENDANVHEYIPCTTKEEALTALNGAHYTSINFGHPIWGQQCNVVRAAMMARIEDRDFICNAMGDVHRSVSEAFPGNITVEYGIGYAGTFAKFRVFESYSWMHMNYAKEESKIMSVDGRFYDAVIPGFFEDSQFPVVDLDDHDDYLLYVGRMIHRKGINVAVQVAERTGKRLVMAGPGEPPKASCVEYVGEVGPTKRFELMSKARALLAPTLYIEPFGNVVTEALACGTPAITTDWGAFTETVEQGVDGFRARTLAEFANAVALASHLKRDTIRKRAFDRFAASSVGMKFEEHFSRLYGLWDEGWAK